MPRKTKTANHEEKVKKTKNPYAHLTPEQLDRLGYRGDISAEELIAEDELAEEPQEQEPAPDAH